ncbi:MAG: phosphopentomutase [Lachnospiraceae bacterium]|nr:phosphopentomutase [Lachnospiraceae bacterium]
MKRFFIIVLDSFGCGAAPDSEAFGDFDVSTIRAVTTSAKLDVPQMKKLGLFQIEGVEVADGFDRGTEHTGVIARLRERSAGKDTTIGHWELAGVYSKDPLPTYPDGFPEEVLEAFRKATGRGVLCNKPYSGTDVIRDYGEEHMRTGDLIVYTSADSVFQIAAHEEIVPVETLYEYCRMAREILQGRHGVGRVIARPFIGNAAEGFTRTSRRHDFSLLPPSVTMLDQLKEAGKDVLAIGKIQDIFVGRGITEHVYTTGNPDGIDRTLAWMDRDFDGLCFVNLVDTDMIYGHRRDIDGYAAALTYFDQHLGAMMDKLREEDLLLITADHGCDPSYTRTTDHTREYVPMLLWGPSLHPADLGTRSTFADVGATVLDYFGITPQFEGRSMLKDL